MVSKLVQDVQPSDELSMQRRSWSVPRVIVSEALSNAQVKGIQSAPDHTETGLPYS